MSRTTRPDATPTARRGLCGLVLAVAVSGVAVAPVLVGVRTEVRAAASYSALAVANGVINTVSDGAVFPLGAEAEVDGPSAQAVIDSSGTSTGFASFPYPGSFVLSVPGLLAGAGHPLPANPFDQTYVESNGARPKASQATPAYDLEAQSAPGTSTASATAGQKSSAATASYAESTATVKFDQNSGVVSAASQALVEAISIGPLQIGKMSSSATATRDATGKLTSSSSLHLADATVNGVAVDLGDQGLTVAGTTAPVPGNPIAQQLGAVGVTATYLAAQPLRGGVMSPGLEITYTQQPKGAAIRMFLGVSLATVNSGPGSAPPGAGITAGAVTLSLPAAAGPAFAPDGVTSLGTTGAPVPALQSPAAAAGAGSNAAPQAAPPVTARARGAGALIENGGRFYLILVAAALLAFAASQLIRWMGVRWARSS